jgi:hypothetical protein
MSAALQMDTKPQKQGVPGVPRPARPAHVVGSDAEAIDIAQDLAGKFAAGAAQRDRHRILPMVH